MRRRGVRVWRDERSIAGGVAFSDAIENAIRDSRGVVVLLTSKAASSTWLNYEYAFAIGARIPVVAVMVKGAKIPEPMQRFQVVRYTPVQEAAKRALRGIDKQLRNKSREVAAPAKLVAKFREVNGVIDRASDGSLPSLCMELWIEGAPPATSAVHFEIPDQGFVDRMWTIKRSDGFDRHRQFLTDDLNSYGDVEVWAVGDMRGGKSWSSSTTLSEALRRYYADHPKTPAVRRALRQIESH